MILWGVVIRQEIAGGVRTVGDECEDLRDQPLLYAGILEEMISVEYSPTTVR